MAKRTKFEASGDEYDYVAKCMKCKHSYTRRDESDVLFCRLKECRYEGYKENEHNRWWRNVKEMAIK